MLQALVGIAIAVFAIWLILTLAGAVLGGLIHFAWIIIVIALAVWLVQRLAVRRRSRLM